MYKNLLVPLSFEEEQGTEKVLRAASSLACEDAVVTLMHVMGPVPKYAESYFPIGFQDDAKAAVRTSLEEMAAGLPNAVGLVEEGNAGKVILKWINENGVDCVVMSSHKPGSNEFNLGSTAAFVLRHVRCAVHVVR